MESLKNEIQASDRDIEEYLKKLHVVIVDGEYSAIKRDLKCFFFRSFTHARF